MTPRWSTDQLEQIGAADELQLSSPRADGTPRPFVTIWVVRTGDDLYVRSAYGIDGGWYRHALAAGIGRIRAGGVEAEVRFEPVAADDAAQHDIDDAYHAKYDRYGARYVDPVVGTTSHQATFRLTPMR
jgi:hypothetical protein